jgi:predicted CXXCH cytochrome family protein
LCLDCHDDIGEAIEARVKHSPVSAGDACASCHDPHAAAVTGLLKKGPGEICLSCHDKAITSGERVIANIAAILKDNSNPHGPLRDGDCAACHKPHGGEIAALLSGNYPARFYSGYDEKVYELCFECHEASAFASATTKDETEFRNGEVNLHHLHVNKQTKGRSCRACHEPHASNNSHHIAPGAKFGGWEIPIRYTATETGGSCLTGCHRSYSYDRQAPVTNLTAPDGAGNAPPTTQSATK